MILILFKMLFGYLHLKFLREEGSDLAIDGVC